MSDETEDRARNPWSRVDALALVLEQASEVQGCELALIGTSLVALDGNGYVTRRILADTTRRDAYHWLLGAATRLGAVSKPNHPATPAGPTSEA